MVTLIHFPASAGAKNIAMVHARGVLVGDCPMDWLRVLPLFP